jgi:hypothetical protein
MIDDYGAVSGMRIGKETEVLGKNLPLCYFVHYESYMTRPGIESVPPRRGEKPVTNRLSYGKEFVCRLLSANLKVREFLSFWVT